MNISTLRHWLEDYCPYIILACVIVLYGRTVGYDFVNFDDDILVYQNAKIASFNVHTIKAIFSTFDPELYIPFTLLTYQIEHLLAGFSPWIYHLTNVVLHGATSYLVLRCLQRMTGDKLLSALGAIAFCVHPLNTEAVAWISARKDLLSAFLFFGSLYQYLLHEEKETTAYPVKSILLFAAALLSKVSVAPLPIFFLLWRWYKGKPFTRLFFKSITPYFALSIALGAVAILGKEGNISMLTLTEQILLFGKSYIHFITRVIFPFDLRLIYNQNTVITWRSMEFIIPWIGIILLGITTVSLRRYRLICIALVGSVLLYLPIFATFSKDHFIAFSSDRYAYLSLYFCILFVIALWSHIQRVQKPLLYIVFCLLFYWVIQTWTLVSTWKNSETLLSHALVYEPDFGGLYVGLGAHMVTEGDDTEGVFMFQKAIEVDPMQILAYVNLAKEYEKQDDIQKAEEYYKRGAQVSGEIQILSMKDVTPYYYYGDFLDRNYRPEEALNQFQKATEVAPNFAEPWYNLGIQYQKRRMNPQAYDALSKAVQLHKKYVPAMYHLAGVAAELGKIEEAVTLLEQVQRIVPGYEKTEYHLSNLKMMMH